MILLNDFKRQWLDTGPETLAAVEAVGQAGWYVLGDEVRQFEDYLASTWGVAHVVAVASGLDALEIALRTLGCGPGEKVLTTPITAFATTLAIVKTGAAPVFVDCDSHGLIDLDACEAVLSSRTDIRFFLPVHLYGHCLPLDRLQDLKERYAVKVVEDCAQSIQAGRIGGRQSGTVGEMSATSFYPTKNLGALGDGGAILTASDEFAGKARSLRDYGQTAKYRHADIGYNSRLDELHAAILRRVHLPRLHRWTERRREIARAYGRTIANPAIRVLPAPHDSESSWHLFPVLIDPGRKHAFMRHMREAGILTAEHYPLAVVDQPALRSVAWESVGNCDSARLFCSAEVSLPIHPYLTDGDVAAVVGACNSWGG